MFNLDAKVQAKISRHVDRVLVVDPNLASTYLLIDLLKGLGARRCTQASTTTRALQMCKELQPQLIFVEFHGPELDGVEFTARLRRSSLPSRRAPVIVITSDTREASIKAARDAGAHEFMCKPFTAGNVFRRVENVTLKSRPWIDAKLYVGPDRRRFNSGQFKGRRKREGDAASVSASADLVFINADASIRSQLAQIETAPQTVLRHMLEQTFELQRAAVATASEAELELAIGAFQQYLASVIETDAVSPDVVVHHLDTIGALRHASPAMKLSSATRR